MTSLSTRISRSKKKLLLAGGCLLLSLAALLWLPRPFSWTFDLIQIGMPEWEVNLILGLPDTPGSYHILTPSEKMMTGDTRKVKAVRQAGRCGAGQ